MTTIQYSQMYPFPGIYKWQDFLVSGVYVLLTDRKVEVVEGHPRTRVKPIYVGQSRQIGPELLHHYTQSENMGLRNTLATKVGDIYVVYTAIGDESTRRMVEAYLISAYLNRGFQLCNLQVPPVPAGFQVNVF
jgi:hypothetical protein